MEWTHLRAYPRVPIDLPAVYTIGTEVRHCRISNLGGGGVFLASPETLAVGSRLSIEFRPAKHLPHMEVQGEVRHVIPVRGMGIEFVNIDPQYQQKLLTFIVRKTGDTRRSPRAPLAVQIGYLGGMQIGFSKNISLGGMFIETKKPVPAGTRIKMRFNLDDDGPIIIVGAEVRYAVTRIGMGVCFLDLAPADQNRIKDYLTRAEAKIPNQRHAR